MTWTRRDLLKAGALSGVGLLLPAKGARTAFGDANLEPFVDRLPDLRRIQPFAINNGVPNYQVAMTRFAQRLHRDLSPTTLWGFGDVRSNTGIFPGPLFDVRRGHPITVRWRNSLPSTHMLPIDPTLHGAGAEGPTPAVRTVVHLHGHKVLPDSDGHPDAWFTNGFTKKGPFWSHETYSYPNDQAAMGLWYHDHAVGIVRLNLYAGLQGMYLIRDNEEEGLNLPSGRYEVPLIITDRMFNPDGSLNYPTFDASDPEVPPIWMPEFFGDTVLVNGKVWPFLEVEPRKYRFRILNSSNARFYHMKLIRTDTAGNPVGGAVPVFHQIGSDQGFLPAPVHLTELLIAPAERMDVVIDFSAFNGKNFVITNDAKAPYPDGDDVIPPMVMQFRVNRPLQGPDQSSLPNQLGSVPLISTQSASRIRNIALTELASAQDNPIAGLLGQAHWNDPVTESPRANAIEMWRLINTTGDAHPIHIHLVRFQVVNRQPFDPDRYLSTGELVFTGPPEAPDPNERPAWKDTVRTMPGFVTRVIQRFELPGNAPTNPGARFRYVYHCHILEHEDNEMMRPFDVVR